MTLPEAIERMQSALDDGEIGDEGLYSRYQRNYRAMWIELSTWAHQHQAGNAALHAKLRAIVDGGPVHAPIRAINTTNPNQL